ncbi:MAG: ATP-binding protein, partial [Deltaproteobacteria bacterium]|nr:ATP-binding protein [Deltaproteobacteria bacterium]
MENQFSFDLHNNPFKPGAEVNHPFLSSSFCRVLTALYYHLEYGSRILVLSAESGLGKTTLLRHLERRVRDRCRTLVLSPSHSKASELLRKLMAAVGGGAASRDFLPIQEQLDEILTRSARTESPFVLFLDFDEAAQDPALEILS